MKKIYAWFAHIGIVKAVRKVPLFDKLLSYEVLTYLIFGVLTTVVNFTAFYLCDKLLGARHLIDFTLVGRQFSVTLEDVSTFIAWIVAVLFSFVTNKLFVFESKSSEAKTVIGELLGFFAARVLSFLVFESLGFMLLRNILISVGISETVAKWSAKLLTSVFVVVFNYVASKFVVFRKRNKGGEDK